MMRLWVLLLALWCIALPARAEPIRLKDLVEFDGVRGNDLVGYGLVVGLNGTGDGLRNAPFTEEIMANLLERLGANVAGESFRPRNVAAVFVTAALPPFARAGGRIDVAVSAIGGATSLQGGTLVMTPMNGADGQIYAVAQGSILAGGVSAEGEGARVVQGVPTAGVIPSGARVEREVEFDFAGLTTLRLGLIEDFDAEVTPLLLQGLARDLKGCRFLLETGASHRLLDQLEARALDMVVSADLGSEGADDGWREVHPLMAEPFVAVTPKGRDLADLPLIQYTARHLMGRQIASHLARQNLKLTHRFELDSYRAILAMVSGGAGWTILMPLALHHASRFREGVDVLPLPFAPLERSLSLSARAGVLKDMPAQVAGHLRQLIATQVVAPALAEWPWMAAGLRVL